MEMFSASTLSCNIIREIQGSGLEGPIPASISLLTNLTQLAISDLNGDGSLFPNLSSMTNMQKLVLRGCNLRGTIPDYLSQMSKLQYIDLGKCLNPCLKFYYSVHINCGGPGVIIGDKVFEADQDQSGAARFHPSNDSWGFSNTGSLWNTDDTTDEYYATNVSILTMNDSQLYTTARRSPLSLTYYGRCLVNGNYTVTLHFAEIVFRDTRSYQGLGRRAFDVYVQGVNILKDFDIKNEAGGVDMAVIKTSKCVVTNGTLEIRFLYVGKGTTAVPVRGFYGPLISAISMESDFKPLVSKPPSHGKKRTFLIVGAVAAALFLTLIFVGIAWKKGYIGNQILRERDLRGLNLKTGVFTYKQIKAATDNFAESNKLGEGGFGSVYKGALLDGTLIALNEKENTHISTRVAGTLGYMAPEYALWGYLTYKADVYSFGVLALEIVAGKNNMKYQPNADYVSLLDLAVVLKEKGSLIDLVDPRLGSNFNKIEAVRMMKVAILCTNQSPALRPSMSEVVNMLEGRTKIKESDMNLVTSEDDFRLQAVRGKLEHIQQSTSSVYDLYPNSQISEESRIIGE
ncbi:hypothetical protein L1987_39452 [Smallanthus sonchifolius]|uniref:Uncharacterized protein n=1 Tax=Smallanthus sonchifolius TaxID=185202 RepID=A0ACB9HPK1_9ASTR|nr:hypothetical protein L1987_39452 [Smallanthus sonchifolius]